MSSERRAYRIAATAEFLKKNLIQIVLLVLTVILFAMSGLVYWAEREVPGAHIQSYTEALWFGLVTILTVGYGDYVPVTPIGRFTTSCMMFAGVVSVGIFTAKFSSILLREVLIHGRYFVDTTKLKGHFIIVGWKEDMADLLSHITNFNKSYTTEDLVLVADVPKKDLADLRSDKRFIKLKVIQGESFQINTLMKANPRNAKRILILADRSLNEHGQTSTAQEADARTVMTAISLHNIAPHVSITAEILDPRFAYHLKNAGINDIIYSREYSRLLLGNASGSTGINNVIYDLLNPETKNMIKTIHIEDRYHGMNFGEFKSEFERRHRNIVVLGLLENTGNPSMMKERAVREAQKTSDVRQMIQNLKAAKNMDYNKPLFAPPNEYPIGDRCQLIVIDTESSTVERLQAS